MKSEREITNIQNEAFREIELVKDTLETMLLGMVQKHGLTLTAMASMFAFTDTIGGHTSQKKWKDTEDILREFKTIMKNHSVECDFEIKCCDNKTIKV